MAFRSVDDFLNHRGSESTAAKRLKGWAKNIGFLHWWNHLRILPTAIWYHRFPEFVVRADKVDANKKLHNVWTRSYACWEPENILKKQRFRTPEGHREHPPMHCSQCRVAEAVRELIAEGKLADTDTLFEFTGSDKPEENTVIRAGCFANVWKRDSLSEEDKERLKKHRIYMSEAWKENGLAKLNYILVGVNQDDLQAGLQVAVQTQDVGDKMKKCINREIASKAGDAGNPFKNPYCIRFEFNAAEKEFGKKYDAFRMDRFGMTSEIERLISGEPPSLKRYTQRFNQKQMRMTLEAHATPLAKQLLPWDEIYRVPQLVEEEDEPKKEQSQVPANLAENAARLERAIHDQPGDKMPVGVRVVETPAPAKPEVPWGDPCDECKAPMRVDQSTCSKCGQKYNITPDPTPAAATMAAAPAVPTNSSRESPAASPPVDTGDIPEALYDDGDVPF